MSDSPLTRKLLSGLAKNPKDLKKAVDKKDPIGDDMINKAKTDKPGVRVAAKDIRNYELKKAAKQDAQDDMKSDFKEEKLNEISLDTLSQAARVAMTKRDAARGTSDYMKRQKQTEKFTNAAVKKRRELDKTKDSLEKTFSKEEFVSEDDMKGMSVKSGHKRPTKSGAGMTAKGVAAYRRRNPGSKLQTAVTGKVKKGSKDAKRRKSYCARSAGQMKKFPKAAKDPNSRLRQARRRWKC